MARYFHAASNPVTTGWSVHLHTQEKLCAEENPPDLHTPASHVQIRRYHTQLCQTGAQCSRPVCFFAHSSAELKEPTWGTSLPQDVLATARLAVSAEVARQNMVQVNATQDLSAQQALGKAVALAVADTFTLRQAAINPALNILSSNAIAADLLVELLAKIHRRLWQWHPLERRGSASASSAPGSKERSFIPNPFVLSLTTMGCAVYSPYHSELDPSGDTGYFQGPTTSDRFCPLSNEKWSHFARSSAQAGTVGVTAAGQPQRNAFDADIGSTGGGSQAGS
ncbi:TPA: hypothetical protein ACH3X1_015693 [Trebouxia sp. C0004]